MNRVFLETGGDISPQAVKGALKAGRTFATNGPLLGLDLGGQHPGGIVSRAGAGSVAYRIALRSPVAVDHLELVHNGKVVKAFALAGDRRNLDAEGEIPVATSGWVVLRAWNDGADPQVLDLYPYATTNPVWLDLPSATPSAAGDARYFVAWLERVIAAADARDDYNTVRERQDTLDYLRAARALFQRKADGN
jgi:hypothetical protein